jgi:peroxiredoxin
MPPLPPRDFRTIGLNEGAHFPDLRLPNQDGLPVDLHATRAGRKALVVFQRSAEW